MDHGLWLFKALGQITMVAELRGSSHWHWAFYSSLSLCCTRLRFEFTTPHHHGFTITPRHRSPGPSVRWFHDATTRSPNRSPVLLTRSGH
jgi:hypothetical protein